MAHTPPVRRIETYCRTCKERGREHVYVPENWSVKRSCWACGAPGLVITDRGEGQWIPELKE